MTSKITKSEWEYPQPPLLLSGELLVDHGHHIYKVTEKWAKYGLPGTGKDIWNNN